jgi:hypothetical protein
LVLSYNRFADALPVAATWSHVPQLKEINMALGGWTVEPPRDLQQCMQTLVAAAAAAKHLTSLTVSLLGCRTAEPMLVCETLAQLTNLERLTLSEVRMVPGDALALTALTKLSRLELLRLHEGVGMAAATALVGQLPHLHHLALVYCDVDVQSMEFLAAVARLTQLTVLQLDGKLTEQGLMQLTGLKQLDYLYANRARDATLEVMDRFWAAVRLPC